MTLSSGMSPEPVGQNPAVITHTFSGLPTTEYALAYDWYVRLLGRQADMFPHDTEAVWRITPSSAIYVVQDQKRAGNGLVTIAVDDLDAYEKRLLESEVAFEDVEAGSAPRRLVVTDLDGNTLTFFQDPGQPRT